MFPSLLRGELALRTWPPVVDLQQKRMELLLQGVEREGRLTSPPCGVAIEIAQEHVIHCAKESLNATAALRLSGRREDESDLQVGRNLFKVLRAEVRTVIGIENVRDPADFPVGITFTPDALALSKRGSQGRRWLEPQVVARHSAAVIIDGYRQPWLSDPTILPDQLDVELGVIHLPYGVRLESFTPMNQIKALTVGLIAPMSQHQQSSWKVSHDPANDVIAGLALLKDLSNRAGLLVYRTDRQRRPFECESLDSLDQLG